MLKGLIWPLVELLFNSAMNTKVNRIRRRIQNSQKKTTINKPLSSHNLSDLILKQQIQLPSYVPKHTLTLLPHIPIQLSHLQISNHPHPSRDTVFSSEGFSLTEVDRIYRSLILQPKRPREKSQRRSEIVNNVSSKSMNPSLKTQWQSSKNHNPWSERTHTRQLSLKPLQPATVIILDVETIMHPALPKPTSFRTVKRPSLALPDRRTHTVPQDLSPTRKFSISAWQSPEEISLI